MANSIPIPPANLELPVEVIGADLDGQQFFEAAQILTIHRNGASILLANKLAPDSELLVRNSKTNTEAIALVVGQIRGDETGYVYGLSFLDPSANLWRMIFPDPDPAKSVLLECGGCRSVCEISLSGIELEIFEARRELARFCSTCKTSRSWKETNKEVTGQQPGKQPVNPLRQKPDSPSVSTALEEKRKTRRTRMKMTACIRYSGLEDVVACEDISKGGLRFVGRKEYRQGTRVEVSAPYTKSNNNMFSLASIVYCLKLPDGQFRHGVSYTKTSGSIGWDA